MHSKTKNKPIFFLKNILDEAVKSINFIKFHPFDEYILNILWREIGNTPQVFLIYAEA